MNKLLKQNAILLGLLLTIILGTLMPGIIIDIPFLDKIIHFGVFFALSMSLFIRFTPYSSLETLLLWALLGGAFDGIHSTIYTRSKCRSK